MSYRKSARALFATAALATPLTAQTNVIRVEVDYMEDAFHSHKLQQAEVDALVQMFACQGITLILDVDQAIPEQSFIRCPDPENDDFFSCTGPESFQALRTEYFHKGPGWHYAVMGHRYDAGNGTTSSGVAIQPGIFFIVTLGAFAGQTGSPFDRAATFAHELGHNLGLDHFSPDTSPIGRGPFAPNYPSVMSYQYQLNGVKTRLECLGLVGADHYFKDLDYSHGRMPELLEIALFEQRGVGIRQVDWDCDGLFDATPVVKDLDESFADWCQAGGGFGLVHDRDDWSSIMSVADQPADVRERLPKRIATCMSYEDRLALEAPGSCPSTPSLSVEPCAPAEMVWVDPLHTGTAIGTGELPLVFLDIGLAFFPDHSIFYLQPGTQQLFAPGPLVLDDPAVLVSPGGAVIDP